MRFVVILLCFAVRLAAADLTLAIAPVWQGAALRVPSAPLENQSGQSLRVTRLAALVAGVVLTRVDGSVVRLDGQYGFIDAAAGRLDVSLRDVPDGDYTAMEFRLGLPPTVNHASPDAWPAGHPLNPLVNGLHWNWSGGYVFLALEGRWSGAAGDERGFSYHLATDERVMTARFLANYRVERATTIALALDLSRLLGSQHLAADDGSETTHSSSGDELAARLGTAAEHAWYWLESKPSPEPVAAIRSDEKIPQSTSTPRAFVVPTGWPQPDLPADNPLTIEGVALGEKLFRDRRLSGNGSQSCASCHAPERAFSDGVAVSLGADGKPGRRNAQPLVNLAWHPAYAWDGSQPRIRDQSLAAMRNPIEMHAEPEQVVAELARDALLGREFATVFGTPEITAERLSLALEQFLLVQVSRDSKFDRALSGAAPLSPEEQRGFELFLTEYDPARNRRGADCFHYHGGPLFSDFAYKNNGLRLASDEPGREKVTASPDDAGKFKTPSLRNVAVTGPYMHDGRFATLEETVAHYDHGVQLSATTDPNLAKHPRKGLELSAADQAALVAFLRTLTDANFAAAPAHSSPSQ